MTDLIKKYATEHKLLMHTEEKPTFFYELSSSKIMLNFSEFLTQQRYAGKNIVVVQFAGDGAVFGPSIDQRLRSYTGSIFFLSKIDIREKEGRKKAIRTAITIWEDFDDRLITETRAAKIKEKIDTTSIGIHVLGLLGDMYTGIVVNMSFLESRSPKKRDVWTALQ
jgi:hypothetical protein